MSVGRTLHSFLHGCLSTAVHKSRLSTQSLSGEAQRATTTPRDGTCRRIQPGKPETQIQHRHKKPTDKEAIERERARSSSIVELGKWEERGAGPCLCGPRVPGIILPTKNEREK